MIHYGLIIKSVVKVTIKVYSHTGLESPKEARNKFSFLKNFKNMVEARGGCSWKGMEGKYWRPFYNAIDSTVCKHKTLTFYRVMIIKSKVYEYECSQKKQLFNDPIKLFLSFISQPSH